MKRTSILATIGPSSQHRIEQLFDAGMTHARMNFSHGTHAFHVATYRSIHEVRTRRDVDIGVVADLQGPKNRLGKFENGEIAIYPGMRVRFDKIDYVPGGLVPPESGANYQARISVNPPQIIDAMEPGQRFLINDGNVGLTVVDAADGYFEAIVEYGTKLSNNKGVNTPDVDLPISSLTEKDKRDLALALDLGVDWVALSFVQKPEDIEEALEIIRGRAKIMAKIETPSGIRNYGRILEVSDGIMVARGDMGVEIDYADVPEVQAEMIRRAQQAGKPIVVATQMLESIIKAPRATRAEVTDVANAVRQRASAVMLSGETANGDYPLEAVTVMNNVILATEDAIANPGRAVNRLFNDAVANLHPVQPIIVTELDTWERRRQAGHPGPVHVYGRPLPMIAA